MANNWVSFHTHTQYSILDGASKIPALVSRAKTLGMTALGISDHGNLFGAYPFWQECNRQGIKPIIGMEAYVAPDSRHTKHAVFWGTPEQKRDDVGGQGAHTHMLLIATDATGLRNLYKLHNLSYVEGFYRKPRIDLELLALHNDGLIATTGCAGGAVPTMLRLGLTQQAHEYAEALGDIFGTRLYLEVMDHGRAEDAILNAQLLKMSSHGFPLLATNDSHYTSQDDAAIHDALLCVQTRSTLDDPNRFAFQGSGYHLRSYDEMLELNLPSEALTNTVLLAEQVTSYDDVFVTRNLMPRVVPNALGVTQKLRPEIATRLLQHAEHLDDIYRARAEYELSIIENMGYEDYFLVLADLIGWAKQHGIMVGPGRGSAGGSLVAYLLGITEIDPLRHGLLFERFLNPARVSAPDIDVDIEPGRREEVIAYAVSKYGQSKVAQIITFGTIKSKAALKDATRVLGGSYAEGERLVRMLPEMIRGRQAPLRESPEIRKEAPQVYELALGLEGLVRSTGKHAAGIVISPENLDEIIPVKRDPMNDTLVAGLDQHALEEMGLVKMDILGLDNLTIINRALGLIDESI